MTNKTHSAVSMALPLVAATTLTLAACSTTTMGHASPSTASATTSTTPANPFGTMQACQILDQLLAGQGFEPGSNKSARNQCIASKLYFGTYAVVLDPEQGLDEFSTQNPGAVSTQINGRNAMRDEPVPGMCAFALEVSRSARALVVATMPDPKDRAQACPNAKQLAERLEPLLPKDH